MEHTVLTQSATFNTVQQGIHSMVGRILQHVSTFGGQHYLHSPSISSSSSHLNNSSNRHSPAAPLRSPESFTETTILSEDNNNSLTSSSSTSNDNNNLNLVAATETFQQFFIGQGNKQDSKGTKLSTVFYKWYSCEWHLLQLENNTKAKDLHSLVWKTVMHLQRFLPSNTTILPKPTESAQALQSWQKTITSLATTAQVGIDFIKYYYIIVSIHFILLVKGY